MTGDDRQALDRLFARIEEEFPELAARRTYVTAKEKLLGALNRITPLLVLPRWGRVDVLDLLRDEPRRTRFVDTYDAFRRMNIRSAVTAFREPRGKRATNGQRRPAVCDAPVSGCGPRRRAAPRGI